MTESIPQTNQLINVGMPNMASYLINSIAASYISSLTKSGDLKRFSLMTIAKIAAILSIEEGKDQLKDLIRFIRQKIPVLFEFIQKSVMCITFGLIGSFKRRVKASEEEVEEEEEVVIETYGSEFTFEWKSVHTYYSFLLSQILGGNYDVSYGKEINTGNVGDFEYMVKYSNIVIRVNDKISLHINKIVIKNNEFTEIDTSIPKTCLTHYIKDKKTACQISKHVEAALLMNEESAKGQGYKYTETEGWLFDLKGNQRTSFKTKTLTEGHTEQIQNGFLNAIFFKILYMNKDLDGRRLLLALQCMINKNSLFEWYKEIPKKINRTLTKVQLQEIYVERFLSYKFDSKLKLPSKDDLMGLSFDRESIFNFNKKSLPYEEYIGKSESMVKKNIRVKLVSDEELTDHEFIEAFKEFLSSVGVTKNETKAEITINELKINRYIKTTNVPNPEYEEWQEMKEDEEDTGAGVGFYMKRPKKTLEEKEEIVEVKKNEINNVYKSMDTLYLPKDVKDYLIQMMDNFLNKKDGLFERLGIASKLGICLYGEPGTGKSTTIQTIASYLGKDIYFVNLNGVETNAELKMLFDEVIKTNSKGGIIVFEDIDVMTDIVKPRTDSRELERRTITETLNDNELNLSYLLNLLDGTLCAKGTIFIMTTNHIDHLDPALIRPGRVDVKIHLTHCDRHQIEIIWESVMECEVDQEALEYACSFEYTPAELIFHLIEYVYRINVDHMAIFMALREKLT